jgi:uridine kinase
MDFAALAAIIARRAADRGRILVGIDGAGASGKSTFSSLLARQMRDACVVQVDDFYLPSSERESRRGEVGALFDLPRLYEQVVSPARTGAALRYQRYSWDRDVLADWIEVPAGAPVIVEGVYSMQERFRDAYCFTVFCTAGHDVRLRRGLDRDGEQARAMWVDEWMPAEERYREAEHPDEFADLVVDSATGSARRAAGAGPEYLILRGDLG